MREENRSEIIHDALNNLDDALIEEVEALRGGVVEREIPKKSYPWRKWTALAASVCVLIVAGALWNGLENGFMIPENESADKDIQVGVPEQEKAEDVELVDKPDTNHQNMPDAEVEMESSAVTIPPLNIELGRYDGAEVSLIGFFIYEGRCYVQTSEYMTKDVVGEYVCTTKASVHEWRTEDEYVELTGSIGAKFYEVKGINPEFMLCTVYENGVVETFVHNNGITLNRGWELLTDRLNIEKSGDNVEIYDKFLAAFGEGKFVFKKNISANTEDVKHLYINTEEGVPLHFVLLGDGYVSYYGLNQVCVKLDERIYDAVVDTLEEK